MIKKIIVITLLVGLIGVLLIGAVNRSLARSNEASGESGQRIGNSGWSGNSAEHSSDLDQVQRGGQGGGGRRGGQGAAGSEDDLGALPPANPEGLSAEEAAGLTFMREEEKLARDVYTALYEAWGLPVFQNIASSEGAHMEALKTLLDRYALADPAQREAGVFTNPELQALYGELVARGGQSIAEALKVGALIEEVDIQDLQERLAQTQSADLRQVYDNLLRGSGNHLRAFAAQYTNQTGETYQVQVLSQESYQAILGASSRGGVSGNGQGAGLSGSGQGGGMGGNGRGWGRNGGATQGGGGGGNTP